MKKIINIVFYAIIVISICFGLIYALACAADTDRENYIKRMGTKEIIVDCMPDHPNICRTITTFTTDYKEKKNEFAQ